MVDFSYDIMILFYLLVCACDFGCFVILITGLITSCGSRSTVVHDDSLVA
jgi:hypothetical protein